MTDKEYIKVKLICAITIGLIIGISAGAIIVSLRYDIDIRTDQLELKEQVAEIEDNKAMIDNLTQRLLFQLEQIQADRKSLERLKIRLSKGDENE